MTKGEAADLLAKSFRKSGCVRWRDEVRRKKEGSHSYKKGYEIRVAAHDDSEADQLMRALGVLGFRVGKPYKKGKGKILPVYGKTQVLAVLDLLQA